MDEVALRLRQTGTDMGVFVETWLCAEEPDEAVEIEGYNVIRKDRVGRSGGVSSATSSLILPRLSSLLKK